jgi:hypothetical protein
MKKHCVRSCHTIVGNTFEWEAQMVNSTLQGLLGTFGIKNTQFDFILNKKKNLRPFLALQQTQ